MLCEEKLEVFENGFKDDKFNLEIRFYGKDARRLLLAIIRELYLPEYGEGYVYPFECAKEFWGISLEAEEIHSEEFRPNPVKFMNQSIRSRIERSMEETALPGDVRKIIELGGASVHRTKRGLLVIGRNFLLDERGYVFVFNKPSVSELILKYLGMLDGT